MVTRLLLLLLSFPSRVVPLLSLLLLFLLLLILLPFIFLFLGLELGQDLRHLVLGEDPSVLLHNREGLGAWQLDLLNLCVIKITKLICSEPPVSMVNTKEATSSQILDVHKFGTINRFHNR